jgi:2'-5' RNA ligase
MRCDPPASSDRINSFSLVSYIPGALGEFITRLRQELVSSCVAQSHVTILPPRPLFIDPQAAELELRERVSSFEPFEIRIPGISVFEQTSVVFADISDGREKLIEMHAALNTGGFFFDEPFPYHPHVTLVQGIPPEHLQEFFDQVRHRWDENVRSNSFLIDTLTFVQNTAGNRWIDLADCALRGEAAVPAG